MTTSHEVQPYDPHDRPFNGELEKKFISLLEETACQLEAFSTADTVTRMTKGAAFGEYNDGTLTTSYTVDNNGEPSGAISFIHNEDPERSLSVHLEQRGGKKEQLWQTPVGNRYNSRRVLKRLEREWPIGDKGFSREEIRNLTQSNRDAAEARADVSPEYVLGLLDHYAFTKETGEHRYAMQWHYRDLRVDDDTDSLRTAESATFSLSGSEDDTMRQIDTDITIDYVVNDVPTPLTCHVCLNEIGDVTVEASYIDPDTRKQTLLRVKNYEGILAELTTVLGEMVKEKTLVA